MSAFDPASFLDITVTDANSTKSTPIPAGEYNAVVTGITPRQWTSKDGSKSGIALDVQWSIEDSAVAAFTGREKNIARQDIMLDLTPGGGLDMGKGMNITLGRLRDATNLNEPGAPFAPRMLEGRRAKVLIAHREHNGNLYAEVKGVTKLA